MNYYETFILFRAEIDLWHYRLKKTQHLSHNGEKFKSVCFPLTHHVKENRVSTMPCGSFSATTPINISSLKLEAVYRKDVSQKSRL